MSQPPLTLEMFAERIRYTNPFDVHRVTHTDSLFSDIAEIHREEFEELKGYAERASLSELGRGVVVTGPSGIGKSHLLARFAGWARREGYPFIPFMNFQAGPDDILRTILRTAISILTKGLRKTPEETQLFRLLSAAIQESATSRQINIPDDLYFARQAYDSKLDAFKCDESISHVFWQLFEDICGRTFGKQSDGCAELAERWLSGNYLDLDDAKRLKLHTPPNTEDGYALDVEQMKEVLRILCLFAGFRSRSFILCFDQVDTLTEEQVRTWSLTTHALLDKCPHLLLVSSGVAETLIKWEERELVSEATWRWRIREFTVGLSGIGADLASKMVYDRLHRTLGPFAALTEVAEKRKLDWLFPIGQDWIKQTLLKEDGQEKKDLRPRHVINQARATWERERQALIQEGVVKWLKSWACTDRPINELPPPDPASINKLIDEKVEAKLAEHRQTRLLRQEELPVDAGHVYGLLKSLLSACDKANHPYRQDNYGRLSGFTMVSAMGRSKPAFKMIIEHHPDAAEAVPRKIGVAIADASRGNAATNILRRILASLNGTNAPDQAVLVVDGREPLQLAQAGQNYLNDLKSRSGRFLVETLEFEQYATIDALEGVVRFAGSDNLEVAFSNGEMKTVTESEVYESHHRVGRYLTTQLLCRLVGKCIALPADEDPEIDRQKVLEATYTQLALNLGRTTLELTHWWIEHEQPKRAKLCHAKVHSVFKEVVLKLHEEGKVSVTPMNDYYMVLPKRALMDAA